MKRKEQTKKARIFRWFGVFLAVMAVCGMISRGIYGMKLARVETGTASMQGLTHTITGTGTIAGGREHPIHVKEGLRTEEVCAEVGEHVEKGTVLLRLDMDELKKQLETAEKMLKEEQARLSDLQRNQAQTDDAAAKEKERANADLNRITAEQDALAANAQSEYDAASRALAEYPSYETYLAEVKNEDAQYQLLEKASKKKEDDEAKGQFETYKEALEKSAKESWEKGKAELEAALETKKEELSETVKSRDEAVESAKRAAADAGKTSSDEASLLVQQNAVDAAKEAVSEYQRLVDGNGQILSEFEGTIQAVNLMSGGRTTDEAVVVIADGSEGWYFVGLVAEEERKYIKNGDDIQLELPDSGLNAYNTQVTSVTKSSDEMYEVSVKLDEAELFWGEAGSFTISEENRDSNCRVPLSALYAENDTTYVLLIEEENTFLGTELRAVKKEVTVVDKNETYALLANGSLTSEEKIILSSDRAVAPNDRVRLEEP